MRRLVLGTVTGCVCASWSGVALAQNRLDQADPSIIERSLPDPTPKQSERPAIVGPELTTAPQERSTTRVATAIVVTGVTKLSPAAFSDAILPFVGRDLDQRDLGNLANAVADVARRRGFLFATATIEPQSMEGGVLRVTVEEGRIDAVRVIGAKS